MAGINQVAFGTMCTWWGDPKSALHISDYGDAHYLACPVCRGLLDVSLGEDRFLFYAATVGYSEPFMLWLRGKCFKTPNEARTAYQHRLGNRRRHSR